MYYYRHLFEHFNSLTLKIAYLQHTHITIVSLGARLDKGHFFKLEPGLSGCIEPRVLSRWFGLLNWIELFNSGGVTFLIVTVTECLANILRLRSITSAQALMLWIQHFTRQALRELLLQVLFNFLIIPQSPWFNILVTVFVLMLKFPYLIKLHQK